MADIVKWNDIAFSLGGSSINGVRDISITGSCETEDSTVDGEKFVKRKEGKPYEIGMTAILDALLGVNVQRMALRMTEAARNSTRGYFYAGSAKLFPCSFMMVSADIGEIITNPQGTWLHCEVKLKLKQCTKYDGSTSSSASSSGGSSSSSSKSSGKKTSTKTTGITTSRLPMTGVSAKSISAVQAAHKAGTTGATKSSAIKTSAATVAKAKSASSSNSKKTSSSSSKIKAMTK